MSTLKVDTLNGSTGSTITVPSGQTLTVAGTLTTSGTLGEPISYYLSENDVKRLSYNERQSLQICGINKGDKILLTTTIDKCFMAGLAYYLGSQELGAGVIRTGPGNIKYYEYKKRTPVGESKYGGFEPSFCVPL